MTHVRNVHADDFGFNKSVKEGFIAVLNLKILLFRKVLRNRIALIIFGGGWEAGIRTAKHPVVTDDSESSISCYLRGPVSVRCLWYIIISKIHLSCFRSMGRITNFRGEQLLDPLDQQYLLLLRTCHHDTTP